MTATTSPFFKELDYLGHRWNAQADRPIAEMGFYRRAHLLAELSFASYWAEEYMRELCDHFGFQELRHFSFQGAHAYVIGNEHDSIVACRGTEAGDWNDIRATLKIWKATATTIGKVHSGFNAEVDHLWPELEEALQSNTRPLYFTGHSLGGAMALICAGRSELGGSATPPQEIQTFGCPRVGNHRYITHCMLRKIRWVNNNDFATRLPPAIIGFRHSGLEMYIDGRGNISGLTGMRRLGRRLASFTRGLTRARIDHFSDHLMPGYIAPILRAARVESLQGTVPV